MSYAIPGMTLRERLVMLPEEFDSDGLCASASVADLIMEGTPKPKGGMAKLKWHLQAEARYRCLRADIILAEMRRTEGEGES